MKPFILLLFTVTFFSECKKEAVIVFATQEVSAQKLATASTSLGVGKSNPAIEGFLRLQLAKDSINKDDILINFNPAASAAYIRNEDARFFQGNGEVNLTSLSSDNVPLSINVLPLPKTSQTIGLQVFAKSDGIYKLNITDRSIPKIYEVWLMDKYTKDSLDIAHNSTYAFNFIKADTGSSGPKRFTLVIRRNKALGIHLLDFTASKLTDSVKLAWKIENEDDYTTFTLQKSIDNGQNYSSLTSFTSSASGVYSFTDKMPANTTVQYRLKYEDRHADVAYSRLISVKN
jgi:hypothetical protein